MSMINVTNLTFAYDGSYDNVFENVSFCVDSSWKLGFIGRNGRGKTTFLRLLQGKYEYLGKISASVEFEYFPFEVQEKEKDTLAIFEQIVPSCEPWKIQRELSLLEVDEEVLYRPFRLLSFGEQTKVLLCALFLKENAFLLIDEPTNHLDMHGRAVLSKYLNGKKGFILVSHDRDFLDGCIDHVLSINRADIEVQKGNFSSWHHNKEMQDNFELASNKKLTQDIKRLEASARQTAAWSDKIEDSKIGTHAGDRGFIGAEAARMAKRSKNTLNRRQSAIEEKSALLKNIESSEKLKISPLEYFKPTMVRAADLSLSFGDYTVFSGLTFEINRGDRVALMGKNGSGKSSLIKLILGNNIAHSGDISAGSGLITSYISQDTSHLKGDLKDFAREHSLDEPLFKAILRKLDFSRTQFDKDITGFSAGQKKKVLIAKSLCEKAHLFIWDEPLNYIDVISRMQLEQLILEFQPTILFVEHDKKFCENISTKQIEL